MDWVLIHWLDITSFEQPWASKEEASELLPVKMWSAGVILKETDDHIVAAGTVDPVDEGSYGNVNAIPKGVIISIRTLKESGFYESPNEIFKPKPTRIPPQP
jgi:hypothetical protein